MNNTLFLTLSLAREKGSQSGFKWLGLLAMIERYLRFLRRKMKEQEVA